MSWNCETCKTALYRNLNIKLTLTLPLLTNNNFKVTYGNIYDKNLEIISTHVFVFVFFIIIFSIIVILKKSKLRFRNVSLTKFQDTWQRGQLILLFFYTSCSNISQGALLIDFNKYHQGPLKARLYLQNSYTFHLISYLETLQKEQIQWLKWTYGLLFSSYKLIS